MVQKTALIGAVKTNHSWVLFSSVVGRGRCMKRRFACCLQKKQNRKRRWRKKILEHVKLLQSAMMKQQARGVKTRSGGRGKAGTVIAGYHPPAWLLPTPVVTRTSFTTPA